MALIQRLHFFITLLRNTMSPIPFLPSTALFICLIYIIWIIWRVGFFLRASSPIAVTQAIERIIAVVKDFDPLLEDLTFEVDVHDRAIEQGHTSTPMTEEHTSQTQLVDT